MTSLINIFVVRFELFRYGFLRESQRAREARDIHITGPKGEKEVLLSSMSVCRSKGDMHDHLFKFI